MFDYNVWKNGESKVQNYLKKLGYKILYNNFKYAGAEIDIVAEYPIKFQNKKLKQEYKLKIKNAKDRIDKVKLLSNYKILKKNLKPILAIVEVKARSSDKFGLGVEAVDQKKQKHIMRAAAYFENSPQFSGYELRYDIASVDGEIITYIEDAF